MRGSHTQKTPQLVLGRPVVWNFDEVLFHVLLAKSHYHKTAGGRNG